MLIHNRVFSGERPKRDLRNLEKNEAEVALNVDLVSTSIKSIMGSLLEEEDITENANTIFKLNDRWFHFEDFRDVVVLGERAFWTTSGGESRQATFDQLQLGLSSRMGVPAPDDPTVALTGTGSGDVITTSVLYTFVNTFGEEGNRSEVTATFDMQNGQVITYSNLNGQSAANQIAIDDYALAATRIYRLSEGEFKFVAEVQVGTEVFVETVGDITLAEVFTTDDFNPPPSNMDGLHLMSNGIALGFVAADNLVYASEPFNINAWPYFFPVGSKPVAISSYDNNAVVTTEAYPEVAAVNDPRNIIPTVLTYRQPNVAKRSLVQAQGGVMYASTDCIFYIGRGGGKDLTRQWADFKDWQEYAPATMISAYRDGQYVAFHKGAKEGQALILDTREPNAVFRQLTQTASATFVEPGTDDLYVVDGTEIRHLEASDTPLTYRWRSKTFGDGSPFALTSRRVLSCNHVDRSYVQFDQAVVDAEALLRATELAARSGLSLLHGTGGAIGQHLIAGCGLFDPPGTILTNQDKGVTIAGGAETDFTLFFDYFVTFRVYRDKELVHEEEIRDDEDVNRLTYFDRGRYYTYELEGVLDIQQVDIAGSNSEMYTGT